MTSLIPAPGEAWINEDTEGFRIHRRPIEERQADFVDELKRCLSEHPRWLDSRFIYDDEGSELFEKITEQPEYYQTRTEHGILKANAEEIREIAGDATIVELGSGSSEKTRRLLEAWIAAGSARYIPVDISAGALRGACTTLHSKYPTLQLEGVAASYERALPLVGQASPLMLVFLGSSAGNMASWELDRLMESASVHLNQGDTFLLGVDLVKSPDVLEDAYNDRVGVTAQFTRNVVRRMNRELGTDIPLDDVEHVAFYNANLDRIEIYARFLKETIVEPPGSDQVYRIAAGEMIRTEISRKFRVDDVIANAARFGFSLEKVFHDPEEMFGLLLLRRKGAAQVSEHVVHDSKLMLREARTRTLAIARVLRAETAKRQYSEFMSPILWDLGHVASVEERWLVQALGSGSDDEAAIQIATASPLERDRCYDPLATPRSERSQLDLPALDQAIVRLGHIRTQTLDVLDDLALDPGRSLTRDGYVYSMIAQHEAQHQDIMLQSVQLHSLARFVPVADPPHADLLDIDPTGQMVNVPGGLFAMGTDSTAAEYDNERPCHELDVAPFRIGAAPVTNGEFLKFIDDRGYHRDDCWSEGGLAWRKAVAAEAPGHWRRRGDQFEIESFGRMLPVTSRAPVMHVSWWEAEAFAAWSGKRLPTEQEWEKAASWDPSFRRKRRFPWGDDAPRPEHANLDQQLFEPVPVGSYPRGRSFYGCHQMLGDVWEWTSSVFTGYAGFEPFPYKEYSEVFFDREYRVLRGGCWAWPARFARNTLRNWDLPERRQLFAGFRVAEDA